jgi:hypothetical protein
MGHAVEVRGNGRDDHGAGFTSIDAAPGRGVRTGRQRDGNKQSESIHGASRIARVVEDPGTAAA